VSLRSLLALLVPLGLVPVASAAVPIATGVTEPSLQVDAGGIAKVAWTAGGTQRTKLVLPSGEPAPVRRLSGPDVSKAVPGKHVPWQRAIRVTPGGWYYALQQRGAELLFARWHGVPTEISLKATLVAGGVRVSGFATLDEQRLAPAVAQQASVVLETKVDGDWQRLAPLRLNARAAFSKLVDRSPSSTYRVVLDGPGTAPDAVAVATAQVLDPGR
jgi:hypothetical protein